MTRACRQRTSLAVVVGFALYCASNAAALPARADAPVVSVSHGDTQEYRDIVDEALKEYGLGHYEEARTLFLRAHALQPSARTHRGIGLTEYELRNYAECITQLEAALVSNERPLSGQVRSSTEEVLRRALRYVTRVYVEAKPPEARILVDRVPVTIAAGEPLVLRVGEHLVEARADGYLPVSRTLTVLGGADTRLELVLSPVTPPEPVISQPQPVPPAEANTQLLATPKQSAVPQDSKPGWYKNPWLWAAVGVVVVGAGVGLGVGLTRANDHHSTTYGGSTGAVVPGP